MDQRVAPAEQISTSTSTSTSSRAEEAQSKSPSPPAAGTGQTLSLPLDTQMSSSSSVPNARAKRSAKKASASSKCMEQKQQQHENPESDSIRVRAVGAISRRGRTANDADAELLKKLGMREAVVQRVDLAHAVGDEFAVTAVSPRCEASPASLSASASASASSVANAGPAVDKAKSVPRRSRSGFFLAMDEASDDEEPSAPLMGAERNRSSGGSDLEENVDEPVAEIKQPLLPKFRGPRRPNPSGRTQSARGLGAEKQTGVRPATTRSKHAKATGNDASTTGGALNRAGNEQLHPSWRARIEQRARLNAVQCVPTGKKLVFDE